MPYRMVTNVGKLCGRLAGAANTHADRIVSSLTARWNDRLAEGEELTVSKMLALLGEDLQQIHGQLVNDENQLRSEIREDKLDRGARNRSTSAVRELLFDVKKLCDAHHGPGSAEVLFEEDSEDVPTESNEVFRLGTRVRRNMANPDFPMPPLKHGIAPDLVAMAALFDQPLAVLEASLRGLHHGTQGTSGTVADKERNLGEFDGVAGRSGRLLESMLSFAGHDGVARRIRISRHRARSGVEEPEVAEESAAETEAEASTAAEAPETGEPSVSGDRAGETAA